MSQPFDFIGIGDTVVDAFIRIEIGHVQEHGGATEYCLPFGSKIPYQEVTVIPGVGNSANGVVSASRLGLHAGLVTFLGNDANGLECINRLQREGVDMSLATQEDGKKTNYHYVLWHGDERTILIKHEAFTAKLPDIGTPKWIYLSSLGEHAKGLHTEVVQFIKAHPETKLAFQPGTFQIKLGKDSLKDIYALAEVICINKEEAQEILGTPETDIKELLKKINDLGPKIVLVSDGPHGAYMKHGDMYYQMPLYPDIAPAVERTGAGDAFFSTFISALIMGKSPEEAITWGPINSMNVVQHVGAQEGLLTQEKLTEYLAKAPQEYTLKIL